jgi:hypothetical protein
MQDVYVHMFYILERSAGRQCRFKCYLFIKHQVGILTMNQKALTFDIKSYYVIFLMYVSTLD